MCSEMRKFDVVYLMLLLNVNDDFVDNLKIGKVVASVRVQWRLEDHST